MKKNDAILLILIIFFTLTYLLSFIRQSKKEEKRESVKSALINPKNAGEIYKIEFSSSGEEIELIKDKNSGFWFICRKGFEDIITSADKKKIENLLADLTTIRNMYKISDKISQNNSFGLTDSSAFVIRYYYQESFDELIFGNQDFSLSSRYMMSGRNTNVYEINDEIQKYLSTSIGFWAEPYLIPRAISGIKSAADIQSLSLSSGRKLEKIDQGLIELRHGGLPTEEEITNCMKSGAELTATFEVGNKVSIIMEFYKNDYENTFLVKTKCISQKSEKVLYSKISEWTYNKIKEITL